MLCIEGIAHHQPNDGLAEADDSKEQIKFMLSWETASACPIVEEPVRQRTLTIKLAMTDTRTLVWALTSQPLGAAARAALAGSFTASAANLGTGLKRPLVQAIRDLRATEVIAFPEMVVCQGRTGRESARPCQSRTGLQEICA